MATALHSYPPPPLPMPQMGQFAPTPAPTLSQQQQDETDRARAYKSRNKRPCDFCRSVNSVRMCRQWSGRMGMETNMISRTDTRKPPATWRPLPHANCVYDTTKSAPSSSHPRSDVVRTPKAAGAVVRSVRASAAPMACPAIPPAATTASASAMEVACLPSAVVPWEEVWTCSKT